MLKPRFPHRVVWIVFLWLVFAGCQGISGGGDTATSTASKPSVSAQHVQALLPQSVGKGHPVILDFNSRFCLSCQKLKPKLDALAEQNPTLSVVPIDIQHPTPEEKAVIQAFRVRTVPYVVFISKTGEIKQVFLDDVPMPTLAAATHAITQK